MIRHWVETMGDTNPVYLDDDAARATGRDGVVAPAQMLQVWIMRTFTDKMAGNDPSQVWTDLIATARRCGLHAPSSPPIPIRSSSPNCAQAIA